MLWSAALVGVLGIGLAVTGSTSASWLSGATIGASTISAGSIQATISGWSNLTHRFAPGGMTDTGYLTITSTGTQTVSWSAASAVSAGYSSVLDDALAVTIWSTASTSSCAASATPSTGFTGKWTTVPGFSGSLASGASVSYCIRTTASSAALSITGSLSATLTVNGTLPGTQWTSSATATATLDSAAASPAYTKAVVADSPVHYWPMNETTGVNVYDAIGTDHAIAGAGVTRNSAGALLGSTAPSSSFSGDTTGSVIAQTSEAAPNTFTVEAWFKTTDSNGGKIIGFGSSKTGLSTNYDRHLYLDAAGRLNFGVYNGSSKTLQTTGSYNDGTWHHAAGSMGSSGLTLYVDGVQVASRTDTTTAESNTGYWHIGMDSSWSGDSSLSGLIDEPAVYLSALPSSRIQWHYAVGSGRPYSSFAATPSGLTAAFDASGSLDTDGTVVAYAWNFGDGTTGTGITPSHTYPLGSAIYTVTLTVTDNSGYTGTWSSPVSIVDPTAATSPGAPTFSGTTGTATTISWTAPPGGATMSGYNVYRDGVLVAQTTGTTYTDTGLALNTTYSYYIRGQDAAAKDGSGLTTPSPSRSVSTLGFDTTQWYQIKNVGSGLCLRGPATANGTQLEQTACATATNQNFQLIATTNGYHKMLIRTASGVGWDVTDNSTAAGALVQLWGYTGGANQQWLPTRQSDGSFQFVGRQVGLCLDVVGQSIAEGAKIQQSTCSATSTSQRFTLVVAP
ncbi:RICIN domain-containing protein [Naasia lichenicola]|uniref:RICIN domain-containing protein n=1 Tax=Naasia lichenicola TaxID=2565933 RepID=UPI00130D8C19|nr:LamG-like jellyroll fold domain-containing protein [Naasia lichenicola]